MARAAAACRELLLVTFLAVTGCTGGSGPPGGGGAGDAGPSGVPGGEISTFSKSYGGPLHDEARMVLESPDGGFVLLGTADSTAPRAPGLGSQGGDWWLQKLDANGNVETGRLFGGRTLPNNLDWRSARPLHDGGVLLVGTRGVTQPVTRADGTSDVITIGRDVAVARVDASGAVTWNVTYDSGAWANYDYYAASYEPAAASDIGVDAWPAADGGFFVAAISTANLRDRLGIGFPCEDAAINALTQEHCSDHAPGGAGGRFAHAYSAVIMRLDANGGLRWVRRLADNAFGNGNLTADAPRPSFIVRAFADDSLVLARSMGDGGLVQRLGADGSPRWRATLSNLREPETIVGTGDGFAIAGSGRVLAFDLDGNATWQRDLAPMPAQRAIVYDAAPSCSTTAPVDCRIVVVGSADADGGGPPVATAWVLGHGGEVSAVANNVLGTQDRLAALTRIAARADGTFALAAIGSHDEFALVDLQLPPAGDPPVLTSRCAGASNGAYAELRADGGVVALHGDLQVLSAFDSTCAPQPELTLGLYEGEETLLAAAQVGSGQYVLAGRRFRANTIQAVVMRYDLGSAEPVVWQRRLDPPTGLQAWIEPVAALGTADGGVVLSAAIHGTEDFRGLLLKLDATGQLLWQIEMPTPARELRTLEDGDFIALATGGNAVVTRLSAAGDVRWERRLTIGDSRARPETVIRAAGGDLVLVGTAGPDISMLRLGDGGQVRAALELRLGGLSPTATLSDPQVRETSSGDFVLAFTERGLLTTAPAGAGQPLPFGQQNVFLLQVDSSGRPLWGRVYGGAFDEGVSALALRRDGTIALAGFSDSFGDGREAWLMKLTADGRISDGCLGLLGSLPVETLAAGVTRTAVVESLSDITRSANPVTLQDSDMPMREQPPDFVTARQCLGSAGGGTTQGGPTQRLTIQTDAVPGVVSSEPRGISCGTGLDTCAADFARGSRITLRADEDRFVGWRSPCEEGTGGTQLTCVVTLNADLTVHVEFRPLQTLSFEIRGPGSVTAGTIHCFDYSPSELCSQEFKYGTRVETRAFAELDWLGSGQDASFTGWSGDAACASLGTAASGFVTMDHDVHCIAQFRAPNLHLLRVAVAGGGTVTDDPPHDGNLAGFRCRENGNPGLCQTRLAATGDVPLVATPDFGWRFVSWGGDCASYGTAAAISVRVEDNMNCTATFAQSATPQRLTVLFNNGGPDRIVVSDPTGINCTSEPGTDCHADYLPGTEVQLHSNYTGTDWENCDRILEVPGRKTCVVRIDLVPRAVVAVFPPR